MCYIIDVFFMDGHNPFKDNFMQKSLLTKQEAFLFIYGFGIMA